MSSNAFKPSQSHCRSWFQNNNHDDSTSHIPSQHSVAPESMPEDDNVSMAYAGYADADDDYDQGEEEEEQQDDEHPDDLDDLYNGVSSGFHASHLAYDEHYHHIPYSPPSVQPTSTYLPDESDVSDGGDSPVAPINYLSIANILTSDIDMEEAFETAADFAPFNEHVLNYDQHSPQQDLDGILFGADPAASYWDIPGDIPPPQAAPIVSENAGEVQQQLDQLGPGDEFEDGSTVWFPVPAPPAFLSPNMSNLNPGNYGLVEFLQQWSFAGTRKSKGQGRFPWPQRVVDLSQTHLTHIQYADLAVDQCDIQGIDWKDLKVTRRDARERRRLTYRNYTNQEGSDKWDVSFISPILPDIALCGLILTKTIVECFAAPYIASRQLLQIPPYGY